jgi:hypothetical protein
MTAYVRDNVGKNGSVSAKVSMKISINQRQNALQAAVFTARVIGLNW